MHIGHDNVQGTHNMSNQQLPRTDQQRNLGIIITKDSNGKNKQRRATKRQREYGRSLPQFQVLKQRTNPPAIQIPSSSTSRICSAFWSPHLRRDIDKIEKAQRSARNMFSEVRNHSGHQRIQYLDLISLVQRRLRGQLIEVYKYLNWFTTASARGHFNYDLTDRTINNTAKLIVKDFNSSVAQHFYPIKTTTTWNALQNEVVRSRTVNSFKNILEKHLA